MRIGPSLPAALERVATFFAQHPDRTAASSAVEIATFTGTSDASVIRTAHALGYSGMKDLKRAALNLVSERFDPEKVLEQRIERVRDHALTGVIDDTIQAHARTRHTIPQETWDHAVGLLAEARRVFCYGLKPVGFIGDYMAHMLNRVGVDARSAHHTGVLLADYLLPLTADDALVVFAPIRQFDEVAAAVRHAKSVDAPVVLITEAIGMPIRSEVDCTLTTSPTSMSAASDQVLPLTVAHGLFLGVAAVLPHRATETMTRLNEIRPTVSPQKATLTLEDLGLAQVVRANAVDSNMNEDDK
ncbi:MurR/RpiR family transcriptional regulator [Nesterenkonia ebinurensis]|uniref:MurR/RpiR family transcriptional regulator n=1 Tax=Nesterenkonia ebinurensis TaxID=2608252 RepID=UPI001CC360D2|nr:MurR/RpiR family transcriptional regulator [Nesterenkonia ebinurensis]